MTTNSIIIWEICNYIIFFALLNTLSFIPNKWFKIVLLPNENNMEIQLTCTIFSLFFILPITYQTHLLIFLLFSLWVLKMFAVIIFLDFIGTRANQNYIKRKSSAVMFFFHNKVKESNKIWVTYSKVGIIGSIWYMLNWNRWKIFHWIVQTWYYQVIREKWRIKQKRSKSWGNYYLKWWER